MPRGARKGGMHGGPSMFNDENVAPWSDPGAQHAGELLVRLVSAVAYVHWRGTGQLPALEAAGRFAHKRKSGRF